MRIAVKIDYSLMALDGILGLSPANLGTATEDFFFFFTEVRFHQTRYPDTAKMPGDIPKRHQIKRVKIPQNFRSEGGERNLKIEKNKYLLESLNC